MQAKYINPFTDYGFKKIFGEEASKPQLIDFLNALLSLPQKIVSLSFKNPEQQGQSANDRKAIFDIYCESETGDKFIVELQKAKQNYFVDRTIYYSTFPIREQAEKGFWDYGLTAVYCIGILDFVFEDSKKKPEEKEVIHTVQLKNQHCKVFFDRLTYVYLEMPNFVKAEVELVTRLDKWLYFLKHLEDFDSIPTIFRDVVFEQAFTRAKLANMDEAERARYELSLKVARDNKNIFDYAMEQAVKEAVEKVEEQVKQAEEQIKQAEEQIEQAEAEARKAEERTKKAEEQAKKAVAETAIQVQLKEKAQVVRTARQMGLSIQAIAQLTGPIEEEINSIQ